MKNRKHRKTPAYIQQQYWNTMLRVDDECIDRSDIWLFYYFAASTIVGLLEDFRDSAEFVKENRYDPFPTNPPEERITLESFDKMIESINMLVKYHNEGGLAYRGMEVDFERGDRVSELTQALHQFVNLLPYLNSRHFKLSRERYEDAPYGRHCDFDELCNLDKTIARRLLPTLQTFAQMSIFPLKVIVEARGNFHIFLRVS